MTSIKMKLLSSGEFQSLKAFLPHKINLIKCIKYNRKKGKR